MEGWKRCTALLAAALLSLSLAACGKDGGGDITPTKLEGMVKEAYDGTDYSAYLGIWDGVVNDGEPEQKLIAAPDEDGEPLLVAVEDEQELETVYEMLMDSLYEDEEDEDSLS